MSEQTKIPDPIRELPVRPDLNQLKHQAKDFLRSIRRGDSDALAEFARFHPRAGTDPAKMKLSEAQFALARSYGAPSWPRLVQCCNLIDAIWRDDLEAVRELVLKHPNLLHEHARIRQGQLGTTDELCSKSRSRSNHQNALRPRCKRSRDRQSIVPRCRARSRRRECCTS